MATTKKLISITRLGIAFAGLLIVGVATTQPTAAHVLKQDHGIAGVLHVLPAL